MPVKHVSTTSPPARPVAVPLVAPALVGPSSLPISPDRELTVPRLDSRPVIPVPIRQCTVVHSLTSVFDSSREHQPTGVCPAPWRTTQGGIS